MSTTQKLIFLVVGIALGFAVGFAFANNVNRQEHDKLRAEVTRLRAASPTATGGDAAKSNAQTSNATTNNPDEQMLSDEEIRKKVSLADANPNDLDYQHDLGRGLYLYAMNFNKPDLLPDVVRLLRRAHDADPKDDNAVILLGNTLFLMAQNGDTARFSEARTFYQKALELKPDDVYARTALGLSYYFDRPSDPARAIKEYRKSLAAEPRHEMTLQGLTAALIATGELTEAQKRLDELQSVNASNAELPNLRAQLAQKKNASREQSANPPVANTTGARN
ncbi:MAG TPA: tetratricopeptide repeat protein [Pyrinomonadaceae bacterium]